MNIHFRGGMNPENHPLNTPMALVLMKPKNVEKYDEITATRPKSVPSYISAI